MARLWWTHFFALAVLAEVLAYIVLDAGPHTSRGRWAGLLMLVTLGWAVAALIRACQEMRSARRSRPRGRVPTVPHRVPRVRPGQTYCLWHGGLFYMGCMGICDRAPDGRGCVGVTYRPDGADT